MAVVEALLGSRASLVAHRCAGELVSEGVEEAHAALAHVAAPVSWLGSADAAEAAPSVEAAGAAAGAAAVAAAGCEGGCEGRACCCASWRCLCSCMAWWSLAASAGTWVSSSVSVRVRARAEEMRVVIRGGHGEGGHLMRP